MNTPANNTSPNDQSKVANEQSGLDTADKLTDTAKAAVKSYMRRLILQWAAVLSVGGVITGAIVWKMLDDAREAAVRKVEKDYEEKEAKLMDKVNADIKVRYEERIQELIKNVKEAESSARNTSNNVQAQNAQLQTEIASTIKRSGEGKTAVDAAVREADEAKSKAQAISKLLDTLTEDAKVQLSKLDPAQQQALTAILTNAVGARLAKIDSMLKDFENHRIKITPFETNLSGYWRDVPRIGAATDDGKGIYILHMGTSLVLLHTDGKIDNTTRTQVGHQKSKTDFEVYRGKDLLTTIYEPWKLDVIEGREVLIVSAASHSPGKLYRWK